MSWKFNLVEDEKLVEMISKFPCLYDTCLGSYKDTNVKENAWKEIAEIMEKSVDDCKKRWKNIKDTWQRRQRKGTGSSADGVKKWLLADSLIFLNQVDQRRESVSNVHIGENPGEDIDREASPTPSTDQQPDITVDTPVFKRPTKRGRQTERILEFLDSRRVEKEELLKRISEEKPHEDDVDLFFKSIVMSTKKLRPDLINEVKTRCLEIIIELQNRNCEFRD